MYSFTYLSSFSLLNSWLKIGRGRDFSLSRISKIYFKKSLKMYVNYTNII